MAKNRVLFALWLLLWLSIWLWGSGNAAGFLLLASLLAAALEISLSLLVRRRITASLSAPVSCRKGEDLTVELRASNACFFSCAGLRAVLRCRNLLTGETEDAVLRPRRCGKLTVELTQLHVFDLFGLRGAAVPVDCGAATLVMPTVYPVELTVSERQRSLGDSDEFSMYRPGDDPSETFALREYLSGDRIRSIHWKLSEKTDHLMVRQLGLPVDDSLLLLLDSSADAAPSAAEREALGEAAVSVSAALCGESIPHRLAWLDRASGELTFREVTCLEELTQSLPDVLSSEIRCEEPSVLHHLMAAASEYAHIIVVTLRPAPPAADSRFSFLSVSPETLSGEEGVYLAL